MNVLIIPMVLLAASVIGLYLVMWRMSKVIQEQNGYIHEIRKASFNEAQQQFAEGGSRLALSARLNDHEKRLDGLARVAQLGGFESTPPAQRSS